MLDASLIRMKAQILNVNATQLGMLAEVPPGKVSLFLNETRSLRNPEVIRLREALADIEFLVAAAQPFPLSFKNIPLIKDLIARAKAGEFERRQP